MNCRKVRKLLPLYVGGDISSKKEEAIRFHIGFCARCQKAYEAYAKSVRITTEWLGESRVAWGEAEWTRALRNALSEKSKSSRGFAPWSFRKGWAFAIMGAVMVVLIFLVTRPLFLGIEDFSERASLAKGLPQYQESTEVKASQDVVSMTMVSRETGLKVVWFLNKNFNLEENE